MTGYALDAPTHAEPVRGARARAAHPARGGGRPRRRPRRGRGRGRAPVDHLPPRRAGDRAHGLRAAARDVRDQRHGHGQRARGGTGLRRGRRPSSSSPATRATRTSRRAGRSARPTRWAAATPTAPARAQPSWSWRRTARATSPTGAAVASVRAGNVIGPGDWAADRIVPDIVRAVTRGRAGGGPQPRRRPPVAARAGARCRATSGSAPRLLARRATASPGRGTSGPTDTGGDRTVRWVVEHVPRGVGRRLLDDPGRRARATRTRRTT